MRLVLWAIAVAVVIGLGCSTVYRAGPFTFGKCDWGSKVHRTDFTVYTAAGQAVQDGTDIYAARNLRGWAYVYPPPFAILMVPFARLPLFWSAMLCYVLSLFFLGGLAGALGFKRFGFAATMPIACLLVILASPTLLMDARHRWHAWAAR